MADDPAAVERGVLTASAEAWDLVVRRAKVIGSSRDTSGWVWRPRTRRQTSWVCRGGDTRTGNWGTRRAWQLDHQAGSWSGDRGVAGPSKQVASTVSA